MSERTVTVPAEMVVVLLPKEEGIEVVPPVLRIRQGKYMTWHSPNGGRFEIDFKPGESPLFTHHLSHESATSLNQVVHRREKPYKYTVTRESNNEKLDPEVVVDPPTGGG